MIKLKFLKACIIKSIKSINFFCLFHFRIFQVKRKKDNMTQDIATVKNGKKKEKEEEKGKEKKIIK